MYDTDQRLGFLIIFVVLILLAYGVHVYLKERRKGGDPENAENSANDDDVFNISGRVNNQQDTASNWPTHDHRISVDFGLANEYIKDTRPPPPPYAEVDLPSYEQATGCNPVRNELTPVHQTTSSRPGPSQ